MEQHKYWQSFGELNKTDAYQDAAKGENRPDEDELPFEDEGILEAKTPRRDFLKYLGFSTAAAAIAASCEVPIKKAIPFVNKPEDFVPGVGQARHGQGEKVRQILAEHGPTLEAMNSLTSLLGSSAQARTTGLTGEDAVKASQSIEMYAKPFLRKLENYNRLTPEVQKIVNEQAPSVGLGHGSLRGLTLLKYQLVGKAVRDALQSQLKPLLLGGDYSQPLQMRRAE